MHRSRFSAWPARACAAALLALLAACSDTRPGNNYHVATVAASLRHRLVFVAAPMSGAVDVLGMGSPDAPHQMTHVRRLSDPARNRVLRIAVDDDRQRLWVVDAKAVYVHSLDDLRLLKRYERQGDPQYDRWSDLALDANGDAYLLARGGARIFRIDHASGRLERWLDPFTSARTAALYLSNRVIIDEKTHTLTLVSPVDGTLVAIDLGTRRMRPLQQAAPADFTCGIPFWKDEAAASGRRLTVLDCAGNWIAEAVLDGSRVQATVAGEMSFRNESQLTRFDCSRPALVSC